MSEYFDEMTSGIDVHMDGSGFGWHTLYRNDLRSWWWAVTKAKELEPEIIATGPATSEQDAERRAQHFLASAKALCAHA